MRGNVCVVHNKRTHSDYLLRCMHACMQLQRRANDGDQLHVNVSANKLALRNGQHLLKYVTRGTSNKSTWRHSRPLRHYVYRDVAINFNVIPLRTSPCT